MWDYLATGAAKGWQEAIGSAGTKELSEVASAWIARLEALGPQGVPGLDFPAALASARRARALLAEALEAPARAQAKVEEARQSLAMLASLLSFAMGAFEFMTLFGPALLCCCC